MEVSFPFETSEAVYPTTQFHGPEECKGRLHRLKNAKTRDFDTVYKNSAATKICGTCDQ